MKKCIKHISFLLAVLMVLPLMPVFAANDVQTLVQEGLVAHYDGANNTGDGHDDDVTEWTDLAGENHIALELSDKTYFTKTALHLSAAQFDFPDALLDVVNGDEFTVELRLGEIASVGSSYTTMINSANDNFALFLRADGDYIEFKNGSNGRPKVAGGKDYAENSTIALTFSLSEKACVMYVDGHEIGRTAISSTIGATSPLFFGHTGATKVHTADYEAMRFYNRALSVDEIEQNAKADGTYDETVVSDLPFIDTAATQLDVVGDLALVEIVDSEEALAALLSAKNKPASAIYYLNDNLKLTDEQGTVLGTYDFTYVIKNVKDIVPVFYLKSAQAANALSAASRRTGFKDYSVVGTDPEVVKAARTQNPVCRGILDLSKTFAERTDLTDRELSDIRRAVNTALAKTVILPRGVANKEDIETLNGYQINPWILAEEGLESTVDALYLLLSGAHGIISDNTTLLVETANGVLADSTLLRAPLNVGHRGTYASIANAPENTLENALVAYENGANALEIDVFITKDGVIVLHHDSGTGTGKMKAPDGSTANWGIEISNWSALSKLYYTGYYETNEDGSYKLDEEGNKIEYTGFHLTTLESMLKEFKGKDVELVIEIKSSKEAIVPALKELIDRYNMYDQCMIISFPSFGLQDDLATYFPELLVGSLLSTASSTDPEQALYYTAKDFQAVNALPDLNYSGYGAPYVRAARHRGISVMGWTINDINSIYAGILDGLTGITTDNCHVIGALAKSVTATTPYWVKPGAEVTVNAVVESYARTTLEGAFLSVIDGEELLASVDGMTMTFNAQAEGSVTYLVGCKQTLGEVGDYTVYCQPVTIYVGDEEMTAPEKETVTEVDLLTLIGAEETFYNTEEDDKVAVYLQMEILNIDASSVADLFAKKDQYTFVLTANGKNYTVVPSAYDESTNVYTFALTGEGFVPEADTLYALSLSVYEGETLKYRSVNGLTVRTSADLMPAHEHQWSSVQNYLVKPTIYEEGVGYYLCTVCGAKSKTFTLPKVAFADGDINFDGMSSISDVTSLLNYLSVGAVQQRTMIKKGVVHKSMLNCDGDAKGAVSISDVTALLGYLSGDKNAIPQIEQDGLVAWYDGKEYDGTTWTDKAGDNDVNVTAGVFKNGALVLDNQQIAIPSPVYDAVRGDSYTIELDLGAFVVVDATSGYCTWLHNSPSEKVSLYILNKERSFAAKISGQGSASRPSQLNADIEMQYATITVTYEKGGNALLYVNGVEVSRKAATTTNANASASEGSVFYLGATGTYKSMTEYQGLRVYNRALSADEVAKNAACDQRCGYEAQIVKDGLAGWYDGGVYEENTWIDLMGNYDLTTSAGTFEEGAYHLEEGEQQKLNKGLIPALQGNAYTIELNLGAFEATGTNYTTWLCNLPTGNSEVLSLYIQNSSDADTFYGKVSNLGRGARPSIKSASTALQDATVTITHETGGKAILYVNGRMISSVKAATELKHGNITDLVLGASATTNSGDTYFEGVRIYNRALSAAEVRKNVAVDRADT